MTDVMYFCNYTSMFFPINDWALYDIFRKGFEVVSNDNHKQNH